jgi:hypothetical protein
VNSIMSRDQDNIYMKLENKGKFIVRSIYSALTSYKEGPTYFIFEKGRFLPKLRDLCNQLETVTWATIASDLLLT